MENEENASYTIFKDADNMSKEVCIKIPFEEYKELLIIKGKYEELKRLQQPLIVWDGRKEDGTTILPQREIRTTDPLITPPYKITCEEKK